MRRPQSVMRSCRSRHCAAPLRPCTYKSFHSCTLFGIVLYTGITNLLTLQTSLGNAAATLRHATPVTSAAARGGFLPCVEETVTALAHAMLQQGLYFSSSGRQSAIPDASAPRPEYTPARVPPALEHVVQAFIRLFGTLWQFECQPCDCEGKRPGVLLLARWYRL